ncbi:hypothetical protein AB9P05_24670 [Roseivirga sp. BDSF3-8]|uniref:hypothetical protein n=1 Tax=Roseivirga sp. BDSF3-8 TaxID=3241598 RepID=UPI0035322FE9
MSEDKNDKKKKLTLYFDNEEDMEEVRHVAESMGAYVSTSDASSKESVFDILDEWHSKGGLTTNIKDPVAWQREQRKDRKLPYRD